MAQVTERMGSDGAVQDSGWHPDRSNRSVQREERRRQLKTVMVLLGVFVAMVAAFSIVFHELMDREGQSYSWVTSVYWTLTTMTTLGFGDITFESDAGRLFSVVVLLSGSAFLLVMLPFIFIQFVFIPWMAERERRRAPRTMPKSMSGHLVLTELGPVEHSLVKRATQADVPYVIIVEDVDEAVRIHHEGREVMVGALDDPETYRNARVEQASMVVATRNDPANTNIAFTVSEIAPNVEILASANSPASVDVLEIAGADHVVQLVEILGSAMASRTLGLGGTSHVIGDFAGLKIAEAGVVATAMIGKTLAELALRARLGIGVIGVWERGAFSIAAPDTTLRESSILLVAATTDQLEAFDAEQNSGVQSTETAPVLRILRAETLSAWASTSKHDEAALKTMALSALSTALMHPSCAVTLRSISAILEISPLSEKALLAPSETVTELQQVLEEQVQAPSVGLRKASLDLLLRLYPSKSEDAPVLRTCLEVESSPNTVEQGDPIRVRVRVRS